MANGKRITLDVLNQQLLDLTGMVREQKVQLTMLQDMLNGEGEQPGLKGRLDRLEQIEVRRGQHIKALWGAMAAVGLRWLFDLLHVAAKP